MDEIQDLEIKINNWPRIETQIWPFTNISSIYNPDTVYQTGGNPSNSIVVDFGAPVDLNVFKVFPSTGQNIPDDMTILVTGYGENEEEYKVLIHLEGDEFVFEETFPFVKKVMITFVASSSSSFNLGTDFRGCVQPGM